MKTPSILKTKPVFMAMKPFAMVQYAPPRSGSTLVYNLMRELFPSKKIFKVHMFRKMCSVLTTVGTYRNPLDAIASMILAKGGESPSDEEVKKQIDIYTSSNFNQIPEFFNMRNVLMLKYEDFVDNYDLIFEQFEIFFDFDISSDMKATLKDKYSVKSIEKKISSMDTFSDVDKKSKLHGGHISKHQGRNGYYKEILTPDQIKMVVDEFGKTMRTLEYELPG